MILINIFAKVTDAKGSNTIFVAILHIVTFFKEVSPKHEYIMQEYIQKRFKNSTKNVYVKMLYQMNQFANDLETSFDTGQMTPNLKV